MARDICRSSKLLKKRERERERERKKRRRIPGIGIFTPFLRVCHTLSELSLDRHINVHASPYVIRFRTRYQRLYDIGYVRWGRVWFSLARLFFYFSFCFSFFFAFRDDKLWHLHAEEEKFPESNVSYPMPFSLSIAEPHVYIGCSVRKRLVIFFLA